MSDNKIWTPDGDPMPDITMKLEVAKFNKIQVETKASQIKRSIATMTGHIQTMEQSLEFLSSHRARIISLPEYKIVQATLKALRAEKKHLLLNLAEIEGNIDSINRDIQNFYKVTRIGMGKVLKFRKRDDQKD